ncbi:helix-turn-helix transcriptional regulator [Palaeococcus ferrophilus]|uniref:helix-turn-helix transcriptional regulator n=1 Tax=Palaeococcus ferrophilus TaxID=83868 RepID=UPI000698C92A|nr:MarR family transcriptional regulator [Palaeococcus ferrophilus]
MIKKIFAAFLFLSLFLPLSAAQYTVESAELVVYPDGYVKVIEIVRPAEYTVAVSIPLLDDSPKGVIVVDETGSPIPYEITNSTLTAYFENASLIKVTYHTPALTSKEGSIWRIKLSSEIPVRFHLPDNAVVVKLSEVPLQVDKNHILMPAGNVSVSYTLEKFGGAELADYSAEGSGDAPSTTAGEDASPAGSDVPSKGGRSGILYLIGLGLVSLGVGYSIVTKRKGEDPYEEDEGLPVSREEYKRKLEESDLNSDEIRVLLYIYDRGGRTTQAEVKKMLNIPKTTAWRMFKRLEERGLVRVYKKRRENWVELLF